MIQVILFVLLLRSFGVSAVAAITENTEAVWSSLPNTENLEEKAMPLSKLLAGNYFLLPGRENLLEKSQLPAKLPATINLAEKRIPESVLQKLARPSFEIDQDS